MVTLTNTVIVAFGQCGIHGSHSDFDKAGEVQCRIVDLCIIVTAYLDAAVVRRRCVEGDVQYIPTFYSIF